MALKRGFHLSNNRVVIGDGPGDGINLYANVSIDARWANDAFCLPIGTTAERPSPEIGFIRYNVTSNTFEGRTNTAWITFGSGGGGSGISNFPVSRNSTSTVTATGINFVNTATVTVKVSSGINGNANVELTSVGDATSWQYRTNNFTASANSQYIVNVAANSSPITIILPSLPIDASSIGKYVVFTAADCTDPNFVTVQDTVNSTSWTFDHGIDGAKFFHNGTEWTRLQDGYMRQLMPISDFDQIIVTDSFDGVQVAARPVTISESGQLRIPIPENDGTALEVNGSAIEPAVIVNGSAGAPAIRSDGAAYTPPISRNIAANGTLNIDCSLSNVFTVFVGRNISTLNLNNPYLGQTINILFTQSENFTATWPASFKWAFFATTGTPNLTEGFGATDMLVATYLDNDYGENWYCSLLTGFGA
jgi:hypothetical protein